MPQAVTGIDNPRIGQPVRDADVLAAAGAVGDFRDLEFFVVLAQKDGNLAIHVQDFSFAYHIFFEKITPKITFFLRKPHLKSHFSCTHGNGFHIFWKRVARRQTQCFMIWRSVIQYIDTEYVRMCKKKGLRKVGQHGS